MADETWRFEKRGGFYADLVWRDEPDGHQTLMAEAHWPGAAERIIAAVNQAGDLTRQLAEERAARALAEAALEWERHQRRCGQCRSSGGLWGPPRCPDGNRAVEALDAAALRGAAVRDGGE